MTKKSRSKSRIKSRPRRKTERIRLQNYGNTCYINASLQLLHDLKSLRKIKIEKFKNTEIITDIINILNNDVSNLSELCLDKIPDMCNFSSGSQQDSAELLDRILNIIDEQIPKFGIKFKIRQMKI